MDFYEKVGKLNFFFKGILNIDVYPATHCINKKVNKLLQLMPEYN